MTTDKKKVVETPGSRTSVRMCSCAHDVQDQLYGRSKRVFNRAKTKSGGTVWRCTVCNMVHG